jgi:hypothetical protein
MYGGKPPPLPDVRNGPQQQQAPPFIVVENNSSSNSQVRPSRVQPVTDAASLATRAVMSDADRRREQRQADDEAYAHSLGMVFRSTFRDNPDLERQRQQSNVDAFVRQQERLRRGEASRLARYRQLVEDFVALRQTWTPTEADCKDNDGMRAWAARAFELDAPTTQPPLAQLEQNYQKKMHVVMDMRRQFDEEDLLDYGKRQTELELARAARVARARDDYHDVADAPDDVSWVETQDAVLEHAGVDPANLDDTFNLLLETVSTAYDTLSATFRLRAMHNASYKMAVGSQAVVFTHTVPKNQRQKYKDHQLLLLHILRQISRERLRRFGSNHLYEEVPHKLWPSVSTHAWRRRCTIEEFIVRACRKEYHQQAWMWLTTSGRTFSFVLEYIRRCDDPEAPMMVPNTLAWAFMGDDKGRGSGIYLAADSTRLPTALEPTGVRNVFLPYVADQARLVGVARAAKDDADLSDIDVASKLPDSFVVTKIFDLPFDESTCYTTDPSTGRKAVRDYRSWYTWQTPWVDKILDAQDFPVNVRKMVFALLGRAHFPTCVLDNFQKAGLFIGVGGCGKSTLMRILMRMTDPARIGLITSNFEPVFGWANMFQAVYSSNPVPPTMVLIPEMKQALTKCLDLGVLQAAIEGMQCEIKRKNDLAFQVEQWPAHFLICANEIARWQDSKGALLRRLLTVSFLEKILVKMPNLSDRIYQEFGTLIPKIVCAYLDLVATVGKEEDLDSPGVLHEYFAKSQQAIEIDINPLAAFVVKGADLVRRLPPAERRNEVGAERGVALADVKVLFQEWYRMDTGRGNVPAYSDLDYETAFKDLGCVTRDGAGPVIARDSYGKPTGQWGSATGRFIMGIGYGAGSLRSMAEALARQNKSVGYSIDQPTGAGASGAGIETEGISDEHVGQAPSRKKTDEGRAFTPYTGPWVESSLVAWRRADGIVEDTPVKSRTARSAAGTAAPVVVVDDDAASDGPQAIPPVVAAADVIGSLFQTVDRGGRALPTSRPVLPQPILPQPVLPLPRVPPPMATATITGARTVVGNKRPRRVEPSEPEAEFGPGLSDHGDGDDDDYYNDGVSISHSDYGSDRRSAKRRRLD